MSKSNVIRVVKNCNYTTLSNYHFKDKRLSWKAKGLLSTMLSLPDDWNYTIEGLASLSDDGIKATNSGLAELEKCGYLTRKQLRDDNGHFIAMEYTIYEKAVEEKEDPAQEITEPKMEDEPPLCQNGQTAENTAFFPLCQKRQTGKRQTEKGMLLNTNILNTKESSTYSSSSGAGVISAGIQNEEQNKSRKQYLLDQEEEQKLRERLRVDAIAVSCSKNLTEAVFHELCRREEDFRQLMTAQALEQVCLAIKDKQRREPIRMLSNLINTYLDNIMQGIRTAGGGTSPPYQMGNPFNRFEQNQYDFDALEKELLKN